MTWLIRTTAWRCWVARIATDDRPVDQIADAIITAAGWDSTSQ